jgi:hypothetical protein
VTGPGRDRPVECAEALDAALLTDYWLGLLPAATEEAVEEHLLRCDPCGDRLRHVIALSESLRALARSGSLQVVVSESYLKQAASAGQRVREYRAAPGDAVQCTVALEDDLLVARLAADLTGASRVDLSWCDAEGIERVRMADIPVAAATGHVLCQHSITWSKAAPSDSMIAKLLAIDDAGGERLLGEYAFHHTRTIPGPPGWQRP